MRWADDGTSMTRSTGLALAITSLALASSAFSEPRVLGKLCVSPLSVPAGISNPGDKNGATEKTTFEVSVDKGERHSVSARSGATISVPLQGKHALRIYLKGKHIETIRFRFAGESKKKCLGYYSAYGTWLWKSCGSAEDCTNA